MRDRTLLLLVVLVVLAITVGLGQLLKAVLFTVLVLVLLVVAVGFLLTWTIRRRMRQGLRHLHQAMQAANAQAAGQTRAGQGPRGRADVIDVDATVDDPEGHAPSR